MLAYRDFWLSIVVSKGGQKATMSFISINTECENLDIWILNIFDKFHFY